jgi:hypothetical protein
MHARLYACDAVLEGLAQHLQDVASELREFIQEENAMVRQRHFPRHRQLAPTDQAYIGDRMVRGAKRARRHQRRAVRAAT